ncbi:hypothetical protein OTB20_40305 [Streptomyces sp. H27-H1]|uniref:hypothetical protein n=1 Tax=Streptomyces sp. H27-H1 TaxID=2996461 RepID=UPI002270D0A8|nr:hypothetical protein [Streptomyces sp. H27-H1]MCY0932292.1 hypothetical protein [Streptomyces sp. H27-H1]
MTDQLKEHHFDHESNQVMLSEGGRKLVVQSVRDEFTVTIAHRSLGRNVAYGELLYLDAPGPDPPAWKEPPNKPFRTWW